MNFVNTPNILAENIIVIYFNTIRILMLYFSHENNKLKLPLYFLFRAMQLLILQNSVQV